MKLEQIGFPAMTNNRAKNVSTTSPLSRCELIITDKCNLKCLYCNGLNLDYGTPINKYNAKNIILEWSKHNLQHASFSGGEPMCSPYIFEYTKLLKDNGVPNISISTNGTFPIDKYDMLVDIGMTHFSISIDGMDAEIADKMAGGIKGTWNKAVKSIEHLSKRAYVTASTVIGVDNWKKAPQIIEFIHNLGVADIRFSTATQFNKIVPKMNEIPKHILDCHPILKHRVNRIIEGKNMRGANPIKRCWLPLDDMVISNKYHFPCTMQMREGGQYIGSILQNGSNDLLTTKSMADIREERKRWVESHNCLEDKICQNYCMDFIIAYNLKVEEYKNQH